MLSFIKLLPNEKLAHILLNLTFCTRGDASKPQTTSRFCEIISYFIKALAIYGNIKIDMKNWILILFFGVFAFTNASAQSLYDIRDLIIRRAKPEESHLVFGEAKNSSIPKGPLNILVWNIKKAEMEDWQTEFLYYSRGKDLLLIQEAYKNKIFNDTLRIFRGFRWDMGVSFFDLYNGVIPTGTLIGSKSTPISTLVKHSQYLEPVINTPKSLTIAKYSIEGSNQTLLVISVHAINLTSILPFRKHIDIAHEEIAKHNGPVIYAGDFNTWSEQRLKYLYESTQKLNLKPIHFKYGEHRMKFRNNYLDHAFIRGLYLKNAEVAWESKGSDHRPLLITLEIY